MPIRPLVIAVIAAGVGVLARPPFRITSATGRVALATGAPASPPSAADSRADTMATRLAQIAPEAGGVLGVGVAHVESGQRVFLRGDERFPMASVGKVPIAIAFLGQVDAGRVSLDQTVSYGQADLRPGLARSAINDRARGGSATATPRELVSAMMIESDNTANDLVLRLTGGPGTVMARLRAARVDGVDVSRSEGQMALDYWGVVTAPPVSDWTLGMFGRLRAQVPPAQRGAAAERFVADPRDTSTPAGMTTLLARLQEGELLKPASTTLLLDLMTRATTGPARIKGLLPPGTAVAHKTGTGGDTAGINCCTNDVGIITLPDGSHLAVAVLVRSSPRDLATRERAIARIGRAAYDHWTASARSARPVRLSRRPGAGSPAARGWARE